MEMLPLRLLLKRKEELDALWARFPPAYPPPNVAVDTWVETLNFRNPEEDTQSCRGVAPPIPRHLPC